MTRESELRKRAMYKGLNVKFFNWVSNKTQIPDRTIQRAASQERFMDNLLPMSEGDMKILTDLYKFTLINDKFIYDTKNENIIGKVMYTQLSDEPVYALSKLWFDIELHRTFSKLLLDIVSRSGLAQDLVSEVEQAKKDKERKFFDQFRLNIRPLHDDFEMEEGNELETTE